MRRIQLIVLIAGVTIGIGGCGLFGGGQDTAVTPTPDPNVVVEPIDPAPTDEAPVAQPLPVPGPDVAQPLSPPVGSLPPDLISSTNPNQRAQAVQRDRPDPFAVLPANPTIQAPPVTQVPQTVPQLPGLPGVPSPGAAPNGARPGAASPGAASPGAASPGAAGTTGATGTTTAAAPNGARPGTTGGQVGTAPNLLVPQTPPPPQPDLARAVLVTGVIQIGNTAHAIVSAPNEPTSRYVRVGQRLSNGQVLVKRIEMNAGLEPVVILEENGIEVSRAVGEGGQPDPAAAAIAPAQSPAG